MATALAAQKPLLGQKTPWAGPRLANRPVSRRMQKEKCRPLVRLASGAPVFANGAVTAAMAYAFNQLASSGDGDGYRQYDPSADDYHDAPSFSLICDSAQQFGCTVQNVYENGLLHHPAPFSDLDGAVEHRQILSLKGLGRIRVHRFDDEFRIVNATMGDHKLHPGYVERQVMDIDGRVYIRTRGVGVGNFGRANEVLTPPLWSTQDQAIIRNLPGLYPRRSFVR